MPVYNIAVCDDNINFAQSMAAQCKKVMNKLNMSSSIKVFFSYEEVVRDYARGGRPDLLFLDILLGRKNGIDLARRLRDQGYDSSIILMSADRSFLLDGYSVQPVYFLVKPIDSAELEKGIKLYLKHQAEAKKIILKCGTSYVQVPLESILYIEVLNHDLTVHTRGKNYSVRMPFVRFLEELPSSRFARCHKSYAVNLAHVSHFSRTEGLTLDCRVKLPLGRKYFDEFQSHFMKFIDAC